MSAQHTPGPWTYEIKTAIAGGTPQYAGPVIYAEDDCEHHAIADASCNHTCRLPHETEANARLIAAAPDLLAALAALTAWDEADTAAGGDVDFDGLRDVINSARAAIAKAEGR
jgi:hypothetical protein